VSFALSPAPDFAGDTATLTWTPASRYAIASIRGPDNKLTYSTFDFETAANFDGSKWARLSAGGNYELGPDVFPSPGAYTVGLCAVAKTSGFDSNLSAQLGALSGFLIGRCAADQTLNVAP
jgi:hypothetical protein